MEDIRCRLLSTLALSFAAFSSVHGAFLSLAWLAIAESGRRSLPHLKRFMYYGGVVITISILIALSGGDGLSYGIRIFALLLVAAWAYAEYRGGEMLDLFVWLFGRKTGFDLGMIAEMGLASLSELARTVERISISFAIKGEKKTFRRVCGVASSILYNQLQRAEEQATLLAIRGYRKGGSHCPSFVRSSAEMIATSVAITITILSIGLSTEILILLTRNFLGF